MKEKQLNDQTAYETAGITTPADQEDITATDMVSEAVEDIMDNIHKTFDQNAQEKK